MLLPSPQPSPLHSIWSSTLSLAHQCLTNCPPLTCCRIRPTSPILLTIPLSAQSERALQDRLPSTRRLQPPSSLSCEGGARGTCSSQRQTRPRGSQPVRAPSCRLWATMHAPRETLLPRGSTFWWHPLWEKARCAMPHDGGQRVSSFTCYTLHYRLSDSTAKEDGPPHMPHAMDHISHSSKSPGICHGSLTCAPAPPCMTTIAPQNAFVPQPTSTVDTYALDGYEDHDHA